MFFLLPVGVDYRASRLPIVTFTLMGICTFLFLVSLAVAIFGSDSASTAWFETLAFIPGRGNLLAWLTSLFMHAGLFHLAGNMVYLFLFGACTEDIMGRGKFIPFYLLGGMFSIFTYVLFAPGHFSSMVPLVGASGAISACMGAFAVFLRRTKVEFRFFYFFLFAFGAREFWLPTWLVMSLWFLDDLVGLLLGSDGQVAFAAHLGGYVFGFVVGLIIQAVRKRSENELEKYATPAKSRDIVQPSDLPAQPGPADRWIYLWVNGQQSGPYPVQEVRSLHSTGAFGREALYWDEARNDWLPLGKLAWG